jgi:hypothetical protein
LGVSGWFAKAGGVLRRGFGPLLLIFAITHFVPSAVLAVLSAGGVLGLLRFGWNRVVSTEAAAGGIALVVGLIVVAVLAQMVGYAAATYLSTLQAAGQRVRIGDALRYGLRRCLGLGGWMTLTALLAGGVFTVVALCCFNIFSALSVLPLIPLAGYVAAAVAMVGPAYLFERGNPITRSLHLLHGALGQMLGRLILIALVLAAGGVVDQALSLAANAVPADAVALSGAVAATGVVSALIHLPLTVLVFSGILATYAERRGDEGYTTTDLIRRL